MKSIGFYGAAGTVTGSCFLLQRYDSPGILVDLGMFQGPEEVVNLNYEKLGFTASELDGVLLTHAHLDHSGRLPLLVKNGFKKNVYMTQPTADLIEIALIDSARIAEHDEEKKIMYTEEDVYKLLELVKIIEYDVDFELGPYHVTYRDAGHIMGSASIEVKDPGADDGVTKIVFSGDLGNSPQDMLRPTYLMDRADVVVMESTYGGRTHSDHSAKKILQREINAIEEEGSTLLIPAFSIERTQQLLHMINHLKSDNRVKEKTPVFLDSPMAIKVTEVYQKYKQHYNEDFSEHSLRENPLDFPGLHLLERPQDGKLITKTHGPKVIIAGSGMMVGGRIVKHAFHNLKDPKNRLLIVGYQGVGTMGREIVTGAEEVEIFEQMIPVKATVSEIRSMSAHADEPKLLSWLKNIHDVQKVFLVHGDDQPRIDLKQSITTAIGIKNNNIHLPDRNAILDLTL